MRLVYLGVALAVAGVGWADTVTLRSGRAIQGTYLGGTARQVRIDAGDQIQTVDVDDIAKIEFSAPAQTSAAPPPPARQQLLRPEPAGDSAPPPQRSSAELPAGTNIVVRMIDGVDSEQSRVGQTFAASLDEPVMLDGNVVIPRGADAV